MTDHRYAVRQSRLRMLFWATLGLVCAALGRFGSPSFAFYIGVFFCGANFAMADVGKERET